MWTLPEPWIPVSFWAPAGNPPYCSGQLGSLPWLALVPYGLALDYTLTLVTTEVSGIGPKAPQLDCGEMMSEASEWPSSSQYPGRSCAQSLPID